DLLEKDEESDDEDEDSEGAFENVDVDPSAEHPSNDATRGAQADDGCSECEVDGGVRNLSEEARERLKCDHEKGGSNRLLHRDPTKHDHARNEEEPAARSRHARDEPDQRADEERRAWPTLPTFFLGVFREPHAGARCEHEKREEDKKC